MVSLSQPTNLAATAIKKTEIEETANTKPAKDTDTILQVDRRSPIPKLPGSTPDVA